MGPAREAGPLPVALTNSSIQMLKIYLLPLTAGSIFPAPESTMPLASCAGIGRNEWHDDRRSHDQISS